MTKYFVDAAGGCLGGFDGAEPPEGAIEVSAPPEHAADRYIGGVWVADKARLNAATHDQIAVVEKSQGRALREAVLGAAGGMARLSAFDAQIAALRAKLV